MSFLDRLRGKDDPTTVELKLRGGDILTATRVPHSLAWEEWLRRRAASRDSCPLLIGVDPPDSEDDETRPSRVLEKADSLDLARDFTRLIEEMEIEDGDALELDFDPTRLTVMPPREPAFSVCQNDPVWIAEIPCAASWRIPAHLPFGGFNACPADDVHCALLNDWHARYGAELVGMTSSSLELWVPQPIMDPAEAKRVALEQIAYCDDIVTQGTENLRVLAQELLGARNWFFWWD